MNRLNASTTRLAILAAACLLAAGSAQAGTATTTMPVAAVVTNGCAVAASPMIFVIPTASSVINTDATATIAMACTPGVAFDVALDNGRNANGSSRRMLNAQGGKYLAYDVYRNAARTAAWGAAAGRTVTGIATGNGRLTLVAYGRVRSNPSLLVTGNYADSVTVTVNF